MRLGLMLSALLGLAAVAAAPSEACPPAASFSYNACAASTYVAPAATVTYYAYPLTVLAVPTTTVPVTPVQPVVPPEAPRAPVQQEAAVPQAAPITVQVPAATAIVRQQVYQSYVAPAAVVTQSYAYGHAAAGIRVHAPAAAVILNKQRGAVVRGRPPVIVQRQRRFAPIRNFVARRQASRSNGGVPASQVIIRR